MQLGRRGHSSAGCLRFVESRRIRHVPESSWLPLYLWTRVETSIILRLGQAGPPALALVLALVLACVRRA